VGLYRQGLSIARARLSAIVDALDRPLDKSSKEKLRRRGRFVRILRQVVNTEQQKRPGTTLTNASPTEAILTRNLLNPRTAPKDLTTEAIKLP
jgi:hypothetical protein